jgi:adenosine deaminase
LWDEKGAYARFVADCVNDIPGVAAPSKSCAAFLAGSEKAAQQWDLERRFRSFEASF